MELPSKHRFKGKEELVCINLDDALSIGWVFSRDLTQVTRSKTAEIDNLSTPLKKKRLEITQ